MIPHYRYTDLQNQDMHRFRILNKYRYYRIPDTQLRSLYKYLQRCFVFHRTSNKECHLERIHPSMYYISKHLYKLRMFHHTESKSERLRLQRSHLCKSKSHFTIPSPRHTECISPVQSRKKHNRIHSSSSCLPRCNR